MAAGEGVSPAEEHDSPAWPDDHPAFDTSVAHQARIYDYWLGGKDNFAADRKAGDAVIAAYPGTVALARANRAFMGRVVRYLAGEAGIRQFLDIGTGIPSANNLHQVAQAVAPECRVVYVDYDPVVLAYARALLASTREGVTDYLDADLRDTQTILEKAARTLDFSQPVAVTLLALLHAIGDADDPYGIVAQIMDAVPPGSYLAISHGASDVVSPEMTAEIAGRFNRLSFQQLTFRRRAEVLRFFNGLEMIEPGLVQTHEWRPAEGDPVATESMWCALARKP